MYQGRMYKRKKLQKSLMLKSSRKNKYRKNTIVAKLIYPNTNPKLIHSPLTQSLHGKHKSFVKFLDDTARGMEGKRECGMLQRVCVG